MGKMLAKVLAEKHIARAALGRALDVTDTGTMRYCRQLSLQAGHFVEGRAGTEIQLFCRLGCAVSLFARSENPLQKQLETLQKEKRRFAKRTGHLQKLLSSTGSSP